jgi:hypothetical protein
MISNKQRNILRQIYNNSHLSVDGRSLRPLRENGFITARNTLTLQGYHAIDLWKNAPYLEPEIDFDNFEEVIVIREEFYVYDEFHEYEYLLDTKKVLELYKDYISEVNDQISRFWSVELDYGVENVLKDNYGDGLKKLYKRNIKTIVNSAKNKAKQEGFSKSGFGYTYHILIDSAEQLLKRLKNIHVSTSKKYSFYDTPDELDLIKYNEAEHKNQIYYGSLKSF